jgi:tetratricopeptide (TPR) repeat protein
MMGKRRGRGLTQWLLGGVFLSASGVVVAAPAPLASDGAPPDAGRVFDAPDRYVSARSLMHFLRAVLARDAGDSIAAVTQLQLSTVYDAQSPYPQYLLAQEHFRLGQLAQAESAVRAALSIDPKHEPSVVLLGRIIYQRGRVEEALDAFEQATKLVPTDPEPYEWLVDARLARDDVSGALALSERLATLIATTRDPVIVRRLQTRVAATTERVAAAMETQGKVAPAEDLYWRAANQEPDRAAHFVLLGQFYERHGRLRDAANAFGRAFGASQDEPQFAVEAAKLYLRVGDHKSALTSAQTVSAHATGTEALMRRCADALLTIGNLLMSDEAVAEAEQTFALAATVLPEWSISIVRQGEAAERRGKLAEAAVLFRRVPGGDPLFISAQARAALCEHRRGSHGQGIVILRGLAKAYPDNAEVVSALASALESDGNVKGAVALLEALPVSKVTPAVARALARLGPKIGHSAEALRVLQASVMRAPEDASLAFDLVQALDAAGKREEAIVQARRITALSSSYGGALDFLARALLSQGGRGLDEAEEYSRRAVTGWPQRGSYVYTLALVQLARGSSEALSTLRLAADMLPSNAEAQLRLADPADTGPSSPASAGQCCGRSGVINGSTGGAGERNGQRMARVIL